MMRFFYRQSLMVQFATLIAVLAVLIGTVFITLRHSLVEVQALHRGRTVANMVDAFGTWASQYKGIWVRSDPKDPSIEAGTFLDHHLITTPNGVPATSSSSAFKSAHFDTKGLQQAEIDAIATQGAYHSKNPALVQRELSQVVGKSESAEKFRITSDRFFNHDNAPNRFELNAIGTIRESAGKASEYFEVKDDVMYYARKLIATSACMRCHDTPEKSPEVMRVKFAGATGWGYKLNDVAGVISVVVPMNDHDVSSMVNGLGTKAWAAIGATAATVMLILLWLQVSVIGSARKMEAYANKVKLAARGEIVEKIHLDAEEVSSRNETHKLSHALKAIARALNIAQRSG
jgi:hypothetical protein